MPDWVTHLGTTYLVAGTAAQARTVVYAGMRHILLGALLPDVTRFAVVLVDILDWPAIDTFTYLIPFHSFLIVGLLGGAVALLSPLKQGGSAGAFGSIMGGAAFHFLLDDLEGLVGCGSTTFYPFYFGKPLTGWNSEGSFGLFLLGLAILSLGAALYQRRHWSPLFFQLTRVRVGSALGLGLAALILPLFFRDGMIEQNAYYLGFVTNPAAFQGQAVELCFSEVIQTQPPTIEEFDTRFVLNTAAPLTQNEWVSVRGIYQAGAIQPLILVRHQGFADLQLSLAAGLIFLVLVLDKRQLRVWKSALLRLRQKKPQQVQNQ